MARKTSPKTAAHELLEKFEFLFEKYSDEMRATTQPFLLRRVKGKLADYNYHPEDAMIRETLMEHVGSLPMVATTLYPYIDDPEVDLGKSLTMLAIHDIGELLTGDEMTFTKKTSAKDPEREAALSLLHASYHDVYHDVETQTSPSTKFAKAVDKITPDLFDYLTPADITFRRFQHYVGLEPEQVMPLIWEKKHPYMLWNPFMTEFHTLLLNKLEAKLKNS